VTLITAPLAGKGSHRAGEPITLWAVLMRGAPMTTDPNRLLKPEEAAAFLGLQPCTLAAWREDGSMPSLAFFKIGKAVRYRYGDVLAFIETRRATSTLAARALKSQVVPTKHDRDPIETIVPETSIPKRKRAGSSKSGAHGQQSLF
jgi:predicted DNA-binding transcriptional regulator AlpA